MSQMFNPLCTRFSMQSQLHPPRTLTTSDTLEWGGSPLQRMCNPLCIRLPMLLQQRRAPWNPKGWHGLPSLTIVFGHRRTRELLVTTPTQVQNATSVIRVKQGSATRPLALTSLPRSPFEESFGEFEVLVVGVWSPLLEGHPYSVSLFQTFPKLMA